MMLKIRCSSLHKIMGAKGLGKTGESFLIEEFKRNEYGYSSFDGNQYTRKGQALEDEAIFESMMLDGYTYHKNEERKSNDFISGECDVFCEERKTIIDIKCSWDIGQHPFFKSEAEEKSKKAGYDWQMLGYMWLWGVERAEIHYWLLPTPDDIYPMYLDYEKHIYLIENIPLEQRRTIEVVEFNSELIALVRERVLEARAFYNSLRKEKGLMLLEV